MVTKRQIIKNPLILVGVFAALLLSVTFVFAVPKVVNLYVWAGYFPQRVYNRFEKLTGIHVNVSTYSANEIMYAKLKAAGNPGYDVIWPSSYYVQKMVKHDMLEKLDIKRLTHFKNISPRFLHQAFDKHDAYCIPYFWGLTGIFINKKYIKTSVTSWHDFWLPQFHGQLLLLNDPREVFSMALIHLGYSANDSDPKHIYQAYQALLKLGPNIKLFSSDATIPTTIDGDAYAGMLWNGDFYKAYQDNHHLQFIFPDDGYVIWADTMAIPKGAPHLANAYKLINYLLSARTAAVASRYCGFTTTIMPAKKLLPISFQKSPVLYPSAKTFAKGEMQTAMTQNARRLMGKYWALLKVNLS